MSAWPRHLVALATYGALASCGGAGEEPSAAQPDAVSPLAVLSCEYPDTEQTRLVVCDSADRGCFEIARRLFARVCWIEPTGASVHAGSVDDLVMRHRLECAGHWRAGYWLKGDDCV